MKNILNEELSENMLARLALDYNMIVLSSLKFLIVIPAYLTNNHVMH